MFYINYKQLAAMTKAMAKTKRLIRLNNINDQTLLSFK